MATRSGNNKAIDVCERASVNLQMTGIYVKNNMNAFFKSFDLTPQQYNVLRILRGAKGALACSEVSNRMMDKVPDITRLMDRMIKQGLVIRERDVDDRRVVFIHLTQKGKALVDKMDKPIKEMSRTFFKGMKPHELEELISLLEKVRG